MQRRDYHEKDWSFTLCRFDGTKVTINRQRIFTESGHSVDL
jgi:hypothetical protein